MLAFRKSEFARWGHANNLDVGVVRRAVMGSLGSVYGVGITQEGEGAVCPSNVPTMASREGFILRSMRTEKSDAKGEEAG